jgi:hypothetical protein
MASPLARSEGQFPARGAQPYLGARTWIVRRQDDRWGVIPAGRACGRSAFRGRPGCRGLAAGSVREPAAKHLRDDGLTRAGAGLLGRSLDRLLGLRLGFNRGERLIAQFAQDVVGAAAELAGDREAGAVVVDPSGDLEVVVVVR